MNGLYGLVEPSSYTPQVLTPEAVADVVADVKGLLVNEGQFKALLPERHLIWVRWDGEDPLPTSSSQRFTAGLYYQCVKVTKQSAIGDLQYGFQFLPEYTGFGTFDGFENVQGDVVEWMDDAEEELDPLAFGCLAALDWQRQLVSEMQYMNEVMMLENNLYIQMARLGLKKGSVKAKAKRLRSDEDAVREADAAKEADAAEEDAD